MPYLEDDLELINPEEIERFCFFYMTTLLKMKNFHSYHEILVLETMYVLLNPSSYEIVFSEDDLPNKWDEEYYELKKTHYGYAADLVHLISMKIIHVFMNFSFSKNISSFYWMLKNL